MNVEVSYEIKELLSDLILLTGLCVGVVLLMGTVISFLFVMASIPFVLIGGPTLFILNLFGADFNFTYINCVIAGILDIFIIHIARSCD